MQVFMRSSKMVLIIGLLEDFKVVFVHQFFLLLKLIVEMLTNLLIKKHQKCAEVRKIRLRHKRNFFDCSHTDQFITTHVGFCDAKDALAENVSLYGIDSKSAMFVVMREPITAYSVDRAPFIWMWLYKESVSIITMPLKSFHGLADELGPPSIKLILASHPGRVGSTLFSNMVHHLSPDIFSYSSHHSFYILHQLKQQLEAESYEKMASSVVRLAFKPVKGKSIFFTKGPHKTIDITPDIIRHVPNCIHIYLTRKPHSTIQSYERVFTQLMENRILQLKMICNWLVGWGMFDLGGYHEQAQNAALKHLKPTQYETFAIIWASNQLYKREIESQYHTTTFTFEEAVSNCTGTMQKFAEVCSLVGVNVGKCAQKALATDSQDKTAYSRTNQKTKMCTTVSPAMQDRLDQFCSELGLEKIQH